MVGAPRACGNELPIPPVGSLSVRWRTSRAWEGCITSEGSAPKLPIEVAARARRAGCSLKDTGGKVTTSELQLSRGRDAAKTSNPGVGVSEVAARARVRDAANWSQLATFFPMVAARARVRDAAAQQKRPTIRQGVAVSSGYSQHSSTRCAMSSGTSWPLRSNHRTAAASSSSVTPSRLPCHCEVCST